MLCRRADEPPSSSRFVLEEKWDGWRFLCTIGPEAINCHTRHGQSHAGRLPYLEAELRSVFPEGGVIDGEIVALATRPDGGVGQAFEALAPIFAARRPHTPGPEGLYFVAFDLLELAGEDLRSRPWSERRELLEGKMAGATCRHLRLTTASPCTKEAHQRHLAAGFEGSVAKRIDSTYRADSRRDWIKIKARRQRRVRVLALNHDERKDELRVFCGDPSSRGPRDSLGWATVWKPDLRRRLRDEPDAVVGREGVAAYSTVSARGWLREARLVELASSGS